MRPFGLVLAGSLAVAVAFLTLPVAAIFLDTSPAELWQSLGEEGALDALRLSLLCSTAALTLIVLVGTPAAWLLATRRFRGRAAVITLVELPLVLPPAVAGIGLLAALGPQGIFGGAIGDRLVLTTAGVVCALTFVSAPFYMRQAQAAFEALDATWLDASRTLGAGEARTFARIAIPAAGPGLLAGVALAWGRALGEFGATLMFAGSFRGITQTVPLAIYERFGTDFTSALALSAVLVGVSAALLASVKLAAVRRAAPERARQYVALMAVMLFAMLALAAFAIDLASLRDARGEAQRTADAMALAGPAHSADLPSDRRADHRSRRGIGRFEVARRTRCGPTRSTCENPTPGPTTVYALGQGTTSGRRRRT